MLQNKVSILSTRHLSEAILKYALSKNISVYEMPFIKTDSVLTDEVINEIEQTLTKSSTVVFTSVNAVAVVAQKVKDLKPSWRIFCIGHTTRQSAEKYFGKGSIAGIADNAKELAKEIINENISEVIFFCGDQRRDELPDSLKEKNIKINEVPVYQTIMTPHKIEKNYNGILFFSPSAVKSFFQINQINDEVVLFAIGNTTAEEIKKNTTNKIVISDEPGQKALLEKVTAYFQTNPVHH